MERLSFLTIYTLCSLGFSFGQMFTPNIWTVDTEPTENVNVSGITFFHETSSVDSIPRGQGDIISPGSEPHTPDFSLFRPETIPNKGGTAPNLPNQQIQQEPSGMFTLGQQTQQSMAIPANFRDTIQDSNTFPVRDTLQNPSMSHGSFGRAGSMSEFASPFQEPVGSNQDETWPYTFEEKTTPNVPSVDLDALGLQGNNFVAGNNNNNAFVNKFANNLGDSPTLNLQGNTFNSGASNSAFANSLAVGGDTTQPVQNNNLNSGRNSNNAFSNSFSFGQDNNQPFNENTFSKEATPFNTGPNDNFKETFDTNSMVSNTEETKEKLSMSMSGEFKDLSRKPMFRVKTKFVDQSDNKTPSFKIKSVFVDTSNTDKDRVPTTITTTTKFEPEVPSGRETVNLDTVGVGNINFADLAANTPKNVGQYTTTVDPISTTKTQSNPTSITKPFVPMATVPALPSSTISVPLSTNLQIESLYPEAPFPINNQMNTNSNDQSGTVGIRTEEDTKSERIPTNSNPNVNNINTINTLTNTNDMNSANIMNKVGNNEINNVNNMNTNSGFSTGSARSDTSSGEPGFTTGSFNGVASVNDNFKPSPIPLENNTWNQASNIHVPFVRSHQEGTSSSHVDQFRTDPNVQLINSNVVNGASMNSNNVNTGRQSNGNIVRGVMSGDVNTNQFTGTEQAQNTGAQFRNGLMKNDSPGNIINSGNVNVGGFQNTLANQNGGAGNSNIPNNFNNRFPGQNPLSDQTGRSRNGNIPNNFNNNNGFPAQNSFANQNSFNNVNQNSFGTPIPNSASNFPVNRAINNFQSSNNMFSTQTLNTRQNSGRNVISGQNFNQQFSGVVGNNPTNNMNRNNFQNQNVNLATQVNSMSSNQGNNLINTDQVLPNNIPQQNNGLTPRNMQGVATNRNPMPSSRSPPGNGNQRASLNNQVRTPNNFNTIDMSINTQNGFANNQNPKIRNAAPFGNVSPNNVNQPPIRAGPLEPSNSNTATPNNQATFGETQFDNTPAIFGNTNVPPGRSVNTGRVQNTPNDANRNTPFDATGEVSETEQDLFVSGNIVTGIDNSAVANERSTNGVPRNGISSQNGGFNNRFSTGSQNAGTLSPPIPNQNMNNNLNNMIQNNPVTPGPSQSVNNNFNGNSNRMVPANQNSFIPSNGQQQISNNVISPGNSNGFAQNSNQINQLQFGLNSNNNRLNNQMVENNNNNANNNNVPNNNINTNNFNTFGNSPFGIQRQSNLRISQGALNNPNRLGGSNGFLNTQNGLNSRQSVLNNRNGQGIARNDNFQMQTNLRNGANGPQNNINNFRNGNFQNIPNNFQNTPFGANLNPIGSRQALLAQTRAQIFQGSPPQLMQQQNVFSQNRQPFTPFG